MIHQADDQSFEHEVLQQSGPVLVDFYTPTCGPCRELLPMLRDLSDQMPGVKVVKVDATKAVQVATHFGIRSVPVLIAFRGGQQVQRLNGKPPMGRLRQLMQSI